jgi:predicted dehydrogenase
MDRRNFIQKTTLGTVAGITAFPFIASAQNQKLKVGLIGAGWYGMVITKAALQTGDVEIIAICDVDSEHLNSSISEVEKLQGKKPVGFADYRDLLEVKGMNTIFIGTPPHWHALQFIAACEKGFDIYCEKPLAYDVNEGKAMVAAAKKAGNIVQIGFQRRQSNAFKKAKEMVQNGTLGKVIEIGAQIHYNPVFADSTVQAPPASLDWDAWCGPAPKLPYRPSIGHKAWRLEKEYGNGHFVDWGIHHIDIIRKIMDFDMPQSIYATGGLKVNEGKMTTPDTLRAELRFEQCPVIWQHRLWGTGDLNAQFNNGIFFYGEKATLFAADNQLILMPAGKNQQQQVMEIPTEKMQENHVAVFIDAVKAKNRGLISCTPDDAFMSTATVQLGMIAYSTGTLVKWDSGKAHIADNKAASALLARQYRDGYKRPEI